MEKIKEDYILEVNNLKMYFDITTGFFKTTPLKAVDDVSIKIKRGETLGVVGESGCGKTTLGRTIMNLYNPSSGDIFFDGVQISPYSDLEKIKKEKAFARKCLQLDLKKEIKLYKEEHKDNINNDDILAIQKSYSEKILESNKSYDEKYEKKKAEIASDLARIDEEKNEKLNSLTVYAMDASDAEIDKRIKVAKAEAKAAIAKAKEDYKADLAKAKAEKVEHLTQYKDHMDFLADEADKLEDKQAKKKALKNLSIQKIVDKEKIVNDYSVAKSIAYGKYQDTANKENDKLEEFIKQIRSESKYYSYIDTKKAINEEAKNAKYAIKASYKIKMKKFRKECTMVFQDPYSSLNPKMTVADIIGEPLDVHHLYRTKEERRSMILELMRKVGLSPEQATRYAHEFSGGQRQRIGIARSLAVNPKFIVCDEPVSALDVSIQAQVINTFEDLQNELGLTYLFIAHDLLVIKHISDRIAVMYLGHVVELAETDELFDNPLHPYTVSLLSAIPMPDPNQARANKRIVLEGDVPSPLNVPSGCPFRTRCKSATQRCAHESPVLKEIKEGHFVSCLLVDKDENNN